MRLILWARFFRLKCVAFPTAFWVSVICLPCQAQHPLDPQLRYATATSEYIRQHLRDYTCNLVKRERLDFRLSEYHFLSLKGRPQQVRDGRVIIPGAITAKYLAPSTLRGRRLTYLPGSNDGDTLVRYEIGSFRHMTWKVPVGQQAQQAWSRHPITGLGIDGLVARLVQRTSRGIQADHDGSNTQVAYFRNATVDGRPCTRIQVIHPKRQKGVEFHMSDLYIDARLGLPIRNEVYGWPGDPEQPPPLLEEYTYRDFRPNMGLGEDTFQMDSTPTPLVDFFGLTLDAFHATLLSTTMGIAASRAETFVAE